MILYVDLELLIENFRTEMAAISHPVMEEDVYYVKQLGYLEDKELELLLVLVIEHMLSVTLEKCLHGISSSNEKAKKMITQLFPNNNILDKVASEIIDTIETTETFFGVVNHIKDTVANPYAMYSNTHLIGSLAVEVIGDFRITEWETEHIENGKYVSKRTS